MIRELFNQISTLTKSHLFVKIRPMIMLFVFGEIFVVYITSKKCFTVLQIELMCLPALVVLFAVSRLSINKNDPEGFPKLYT